MEKWEYNGAVYQLFIDLKKVCDSDRREVLCNILTEFGIVMKLVRLIRMCLNETHIRVWVGRLVSDMFSINGFKQALLPLLFSFALEYAIRRVQVDQEGLKLNGTLELLAYADRVNVLGESVHTVKKNAEALVVTGEETGLVEVNAVSCGQNAGQNHNIKTDEKFFEGLQEFSYFGTTLTN